MQGLPAVNEALDDRALVVLSTKIAPMDEFGKCMCNFNKRNGLRATFHSVKAFTWRHPELTGLSLYQDAPCYE